MATDKTQGLPHVAAATAAEIAAAAIAPFVQKRLASLLRSRDACEAELKIVSGVPGFESRVKYLTKRVQDLNSQIFPSLISEFLCLIWFSFLFLIMLFLSLRLVCASILRLLPFGFLLTK